MLLIKLKINKFFKRSEIVDIEYLDLFVWVVTFFFELIGIL